DDIVSSLPGLFPGSSPGTGSGNPIGRQSETPSAAKCGRASLDARDKPGHHAETGISLENSMIARVGQCLLALGLVLLATPALALALPAPMSEQELTDK